MSTMSTGMVGKPGRRASSCNPAGSGQARCRGKGSRRGRMAYSAANRPFRRRSSTAGGTAAAYGRFRASLAAAGQ